MYVSAIPENAVFDYVIVGAGSAGCVLANRLSAGGAHQVLLLEAGGRDNNINIRIPLMVANILQDERYIWPYLTEPQAEMNGRTQLWMRGKVMGGSSSINGNLFVRGDPLEYDTWRDELGCSGWGYADLLPFFRKLEHFPEGDPAARGRGGPIHCTRLQNFDALSDAFLAGCDEMGYTRRADYNDGSYEGAGYFQYSTRNGLRNSAADGYLRPALKRRNLAVLPYAQATRIVTNEKRATGVAFRAGGADHIVRARREVILAAGPLSSPQILELSGIGDAALLRRIGVDVVHHLPGVGENLRDHPNARLTFQCARRVTLNDVLSSPWLKLLEGLKFLFRRQGMLTICVSTAQATVRAHDGDRQPNLALRLAPMSGKDRYARTPKTGLDPFSGYTLGVSLLRPCSVGTVHSASSDPFRQAMMDPRYLTNSADLRLFLDGFRLARRLSQAPALRPMVVRETRPGVEVHDDDALIAYLRATVSTSWHQVGSCKMGVDAAAVVDPKLRVHGMDDLRVIDSSICPTLPSSNTNIPTIAIAEKGAQIVLDAARA